GRQRLDVDVATLEAIIDRWRVAPIGEEESELLRSAIGTLAELTAELERKDVSIRSLRELLFGARTETTRKTLGETARAPASQAGPPPGGGAEGGAGKDTHRPRARGHGRNGAEAYTGAKQVEIASGLSHGERCPECARGNLYGQKEAKVLVRIRAMAPIHATVYRLERLRCGGCGAVFTADAPPGVGDEKYDASVTSMTGLLKYGSGMPFYR
ncbi:hypothetical protein L6Q96_23370, partial [Candidatus Binatia bacterium]|nr:hypothetical protein [Candidatus Binatia bacterium]